MARELKIFSMLLIVFAFSAYASPLSLKGAGKNLKFKLNKSGVMIFSSSLNSEAENGLKSLTAEKIKQLLQKKNDQRVAPSVRLCGGLGAKVWVLEDENKTEWSVCEFSDGSAVLTDDLGKIIQKFQ
jgi:hypothetical protein